MKTKYISFILIIFAICAKFTSCEFYTENKIGVRNGYDFELWKDYGDTYMSLNEGAKFYCAWKNIGNVLFRIGKKFDLSRKWWQFNEITVYYYADYKPNGNSYLCVYGWSKEPLIEYYIVDSWGTWRPPGGNSLGQIYEDEGVYDIYVTDRINQPSIEGTKTFKQYWSVRTQKRNGGTVTLKNHFYEWSKRGLNLGKLYEASLNIEGFESSGEANILYNDVVAY